MKLPKPGSVDDMTEETSVIKTPWNDVVDDRPEQNLLRVRRDIFSSQEIFDREIERLFEGGWIYLAHESQVPERHDYVTVNAGRKPLVVMRDGSSNIHVFYNACPHKGGTICPKDRGNAPQHVCPYHSWTFGSDGRNRAIKGKAQGGYRAEFLEGSHDLVAIARYENYRGFIFGSLSADVESLEDYLGDIRLFIDMLVDQSPDGVETIPGVSNYTFEGNWKHQLENSSDGYHVTSVHPSYIRISQDRIKQRAGDAVGDVYERTRTALDVESSDNVQSGSFLFKNGHSAVWVKAAAHPASPLYARYEELVQRVGPTKAKWMFYIRNVTIFPNLQLVDNFSTQLRTFRPLGPGRTEMSTWCVGPRGESAAARGQRLRQYEDFFMPSGLATPDDLDAYEGCQRSAMAGAGVEWQSYERGVTVQEQGRTPEATELDIHPDRSVRGPIQLWDETIFHAHYRAWKSRMSSAAGDATAAKNCPEGEI
jgi:benzoate/toluate 1,2-dioxygenase alpha subunit